MRDRSFFLVTTFALGVATAASMLLPVARVAAEEGGYFLPLALAQKAANASIASCAGSGYAVSAAIVDTSGVIKLEAKGDHSTVHTTTSAFRKAYTVLTLGPIFRFDDSSAFALLAAKNPNGAALATLPDIAALPGGVAIKVGEEIIAALGVSGSFGGDKDEVCAAAGVDSIREDLAALFPGRR
jgi:uncharacterized protein GlcG (DUF336 family)